MKFLPRSLAVWGTYVFQFHANLQLASIVKTSIKNGLVVHPVSELFDGNLQIGLTSNAVSSILS